MATNGIPVFKTLFAVPMHCDGCVNSIRTALSEVDGIVQVNCHLEDQLVEVEGSAAPSTISTALAKTGKDCILRGSGGPNSAAVCILETHAPHVVNPVRGLARLVQVAPKFTIIDISLKGLSVGVYDVTIRQSGDISGGAASTGGIWEGNDDIIDNRIPKGKLGQIQIDHTGAGGILLDGCIDIWDLIGRGMVVSQEAKDLQEGGGTLVGVIARSAGVWENDKLVCSCSGKTVWEERVEQAGKGML